jgi:hypothetical protein
VTTLVTADMEEKIIEWWDGLKEFHEPSKQKAALVRIDPKRYVLCFPQQLKPDQVDYIREGWIEFVGKRGPKLFVMSNMVFVPRLEKKDGA